MKGKFKYGKAGMAEPILESKGGGGGVGGGRLGWGIGPRFL